AGSLCSENFWGIYGIPSASALGQVLFNLSNCDCSPGPNNVTRSAGVRTYELAVSDSGSGVYTTFATLAESDWMNSTYAHQFNRGFERASFRMRVFDSSVQV